MNQEEIFAESAYVESVVAGKEELRPSHIVITKDDYRSRCLKELRIDGDWGWAMYCLVNYILADYECYRYGVPKEAPFEDGYKLIRE